MKDIESLPDKNRFEGILTWILIELLTINPYMKTYPYAYTYTYQWDRKILIILTHHSSPLIYRRIFYLDKAEIMPNNGNLLG